MGIKLIQKSYQTYQINIYELISVCSSVRYSQMISETAYSSQTKLIGEGLPIKEHGIGYSNLALTGNSEVEHKNIKKFLTKNSLEIDNFHLDFMADEGHKGQD